MAQEAVELVFFVVDIEFDSLNGGRIPDFSLVESTIISIDDPGVTSYAD